MSERLAKLRLHLQAEKALGLSGLPVGRRKKSSPGPVAGPSLTPAGLPATRTPAVAKASPAPVAPVARPHPVQPKPAVDPAKTAAKLPVLSTQALIANEPFATPLLATAEKIERLAAMDAGEVKGCTFCPLCNSRTHTVFGEGNVDARLMFVGEGPGATEDETGRPFVGDAGQLLNKQIAAMGLEREQVYICNVVKCRPPGNRVPVPEEMAACTPYLLRQIEIIRPEAIVTLGLTATGFLLQRKATMGSMRGNWQDFRGIPLMPTWHPAYLLRNPTTKTRGEVWSDLQQVMAKLGLQKKK